MTFQDIKDEMEFRGFKVNFTKHYSEGGGVTMGFPFESYEDNIKYGCTISFDYKNDMDATLSASDVNAFETRFISSLVKTAMTELLLKISKVKPEIVSDPQIVYVLENKKRIEEMLKQV